MGNGRTVEAFFDWLHEVHSQEPDYPTCDICGEEIRQEMIYVDQYGDRICDECLYNHRVPLIGKAICKRCGYTIETCDQSNIVLFNDEFTCDECLSDGKEYFA